MTDPTSPDHPDGPLEARLTAAGDRWRAAQPAPPEPDPALLLRPHRSRWQPLAAAAAVVAVAAGAVVGVAVSREAGSPPAGRVAGQTAGQNAASPGDVVRDGDRVAGQGTVIAPAGQPPRLCVGGVTLSIPNPPPPACVVGVPVTGIDLAQLSPRDERDGVVWGGAWVEAVYRDGTLAVTRQEPYRQPGPGDPTAADEVPCPEPAGGWPRQPDLRAALSRLNRAVAEHATEYTTPYVTYPYGWHLQDTSNRKGTEVYVVGTTGDVAEARRVLEEVFPARHLCVTRAEWSRGDIAAARRALSTPEALAAGIGRVDDRVLEDRVTAELVVLDERAAGLLAGVADGRVEPEPLLAKVR